MKKNHTHSFFMGALLVVSAFILISAILSCRVTTPRPPTEEKGAILYGKYCAVCHGADGKGYLADEASALSNQDFLASATNDYILQGILQGRPGTAMSAWAKERGGPLEKEDALSILLFIHSWQKEPSIDLSQIKVTGDVKNGAVVYRTLCKKCHGANGEGGKAIELNNPVFQKTAGDGFIWYAIENGRRNTPMKAYKKVISNRDIDDVVAFIRTLNTEKTFKAASNEENEQYVKVVREKAILNPGNPPANFSLINNRYVPAADVYAAYKEKKSFIIIDARPRGDYLYSHIKGAISVPFYDIDKVIGLLPKNIWIITYCACPHALSGKAADALKSAGYSKVAVLNEGIFFWLDKGYPSATGDSGD